MWLYCPPCVQQHKGLLQRDAVAIVEAYQNGDAQIVTPRGVYSRCLLDILGKTSRKARESERRRNAENMVPDLLSAV